MNYKNKTFTIILSILVVGTVLMISACKKSGDSSAVLNSRNGDTASHKEGRDCMECHRSGGSGKGVFTVAGTVYDSGQSNVNPNGMVSIYSEDNGGGTLLKSVGVDGKGNFYSTEAVDLSNGVFTRVTSSSDVRKDMMSSLTNGACNSCHGNSIDPIWVD
ncbi:MAG: hypothetical protein GY757_07515 [bacterium]|nr:hypothetical protein [bacterium]